MNEEVSKLTDLKTIINNIRKSSAMKLYNDLKNNTTFMMMYVDAPPSNSKQFQSDFNDLAMEEKMMAYLMQANSIIKTYCEKVHYYNMVSNELDSLIKNSEGKYETVKTVSK